MFIEPHRLWLVLPAHDFPARLMAVSEGAAMQLPGNKTSEDIPASTLLRRASRRVGAPISPALPLAQITHLVVADATLDGADLIPFESTAITL